MSIGKERLLRRALAATQAINRAAAAALVVGMGGFLLSSLACGGDPLVAAQDPPLDRNDTTAWLALLDSNARLGVKRGGVDYDRSREGRITALRSAIPLEPAQRWKVLPPEVGELSGLTTLDLAGHALSELPPELERLTGLELLYLRGNAIRRLPEGLRFEALRKADLRSNGLEGLPGNFDATRLEELLLRNNAISYLPPDFRWLTRLRHLDLGYNQLDTLDVDFSGMRSLEHLDLSHNRLRALPPGLEELSPGFVELAGNRLCFPEDPGADSALARTLAWLDAHDRNWRLGQDCD